MTDSAAPPSGADDRYTTWDAGYVLGALTPNERREFETHLEGCPRCRAAVGELTGIPVLLAMLDPADVESLDGEPPLRPALREEMIARLLVRRRRSRWLTGAAIGLAAVLLAVALVVVIRPETLGLQQGSSPVTMMEMGKVSETPINASIALAGYSWGTRIDMACSYGDWGRRDAPPQNLGMVVVGRDGTRSQVATWLGLSGATALPSGNTPIPHGDIAAVQLVSADDGTVLLERRL